MKVAIVHEWLDTYAGSERVLEQLLLAWPEADLFAVCDFLPEAERGFLGGRRPRTTFIQRLPFARTQFRKYLSLMPLAVEQIDLSGYDLVLSSSHAVAKGVLTGPGQLHVSYIHSPMRYAWDLQHQYLRESGSERGSRSDRSVDAAPAPDLGPCLRRRRRRAGGELELHRGADPQGVAARERGDPPPVAVHRFTLRRDKQDYYLVASRMVPYKRVELVTAAFRRMPGRKLVVIGDGPNMKAVRDAAGGAANITFLGRVSQPELIDRMQGARAALHAAEEDFGIAIVEAQACGTPMIAYGRGGALDIVRAPPANQPTGVFFAEQTPESIIAAVEQFEGWLRRSRLRPAARTRCASARRCSAMR